jgi:hypothetical protein
LGKTLIWLCNKALFLNENAQLINRMAKLLWRIIPVIIIITVIGVIYYGYKTVKSIFTKKEQVVITHSTILQEVESLGKLELIKYHFKDVVEFEKEDYSWLPSSKVVLIAAGEAVGCIDLKKITSKDIIEDSSSIVITLPAPELCYFKIDHEQSKVYDLQYTYFQDKNLIDHAYKAAEKQLKEAALQLEILEKTGQNAEIILKPLLEKTSGKKVVFRRRVNLQSEKIKKD